MRPMRALSRSVAVALVGALTLAACAHCAASHMGAAAAPGHLVDVLDSIVKIDERRAAAGDPIRAGSVLSTDDHGVATFAMRQKFSDCQIQSRSAVKVAPAEGVPFSFEKGTIVCSTSPGSIESVKLGIPNGAIHLQDPIFVVS